MPRLNDLKASETLLFHEFYVISKNADNGRVFELVTPKDGFFKLFSFF